MSDIKDFIIKDGILERYTGNDEHIIIPKTVKTISSYAFRFVRKRTLSITISEGTEEINASAFKNFINLERINLPTSLKVIGDEAFRNCEKLKEIVFDGILKEIGNLAFWGCWSLFETADNLPEFLQKFVYRVNSGELTTEEANVLYEISKSKGVININSFRTVYFTDGVFPGYIYCFNDGETRLFIPVSIDGIPVVKAPCRNVPDDAVVYCPAEYFDKLSRQAKVTTTLKWLGGDKLIKENLSEKIKTFIKKYPDDIILKFENIEDSKIIRRFFEYVKPEAQYIDKLLDLNPNSPEIKAVLLDLNKPLTNDTDVFSLDSVNKMTVSELKKIWTYDTITNSDTNQKEICLTNYKSHDKHVVVPAYIGKMPVVKIKGVFPEYVESIAFENPDIEINCSFRLCKSMADKNGFVCINIGNRYVLTDYIGNKDIDSLSIPEGVTENTYGTFGNLNISECIFPEGFIKLGSNSFSSCKKLKKVVFPESLQTIEDRAFMGTNSLKHLYIPERVTTIGDLGLSSEKVNIYGKYASSAYEYAEKFKHAFFEGFPVESDDTPDFILIDGVVIEYVGNNEFIEIPDSVTSIGNYAFYGCTNMISITIPDTVTNIGNFAFGGCTNLVDITLPDKITSIESNTFNGCKKLRNITIPDGVVSIGDSAFSCCTDLTSVAIPDSVISIGNCTFSGCTNLMNITIPDSVISIGHSLFNKCSSLTYMTIPKGVTSLEYGVFSDCTNLTNIYIPDSIVSIARNAFNGCSKLTIYASIDSYAETYAKEKNIHFVVK